MPDTVAGERPRTSDDPAFSDALTFAFADVAHGIQGVVRLGVAGGAASGLVLVFADGAPALTSAEGGLALAAPPERFDDVAVAGIDVVTQEPGRRWTVSVAVEQGALDLEVEADGALLELDEDDEVARWGETRGSEQPCRVTGTATIGGRRLAVDGRGQRGRLWGAPDWSDLALARTITGWFDDRLSFTLTSLRPDGAQSHADEISWARLSRAPALVAEETDDPDAPEPSAVPEAVPAPEPRISTTSDADGRHVRATVELWESDTGPVWTATGEAVAGTTMDLGRLRLDSAFFRWRLAGRDGVGRYDVLRRVDAPGATGPAGA